MTQIEWRTLRAEAISLAVLLLAFYVTSLFTGGFLWMAGVAVAGFVIGSVIALLWRRHNPAPGRHRRRPENG